MLYDFALGQTSVVFRVKLRNSSVSTGAGLTGLTSASSGLIISTIADNEATATVYTAAASTIETIATLGTYAAPTATKCRLKEVDPTNHKGLIEVQLADARFAVAGAKSLTVSFSGATNLAECDVVIPLRAVNPYLASFGLLLAKTTNLTGLNDIAATAIVSGGAITTSSGAVSNVTNLATYTGNTPQTGDTFPIANHATYGNAKLVRATTPANTLDVSASGEAGVDWANVGSPTTTLVLSGTTVGTATTTGTATLAASQPNYAPAKAGDAMTLSASQSFNNAGQTTALPANVVDVLGSPAEAVSGGFDANLISVNGTTFNGANVPSAPADGSIVTSTFGAVVIPDTRLANLNATVSSRSTYAGGAVASVADKTGFSLAASGLDAVVVETGVNARQALALVMDAAGSGVLTGAATTTVTVKNPAGSASRIVATCDSSGNRSAVTLTPPA